jgi:hypothetical protein
MLPQLAELAGNGVHGIRKIASSREDDHNDIFLASCKLGNHAL